MPIKREANIILPAPSRGEFLDAALRSIPRDGAASLKNMRVERGLARQRPGSLLLHTAPNANKVVDIFNLILNDNTVRVLRCTGATGTSGATSPLHYDDGTTFTALTLDNAFSLANGERYWAVVAPWGATSVGRIIISNYAKIKQWTGNPADNVTDVAGAFPSRVGFIGPDNRLFLADVVDVGTQRQEVRWSVPALPAGGVADWDGSVVGSGGFRLRGDSWPITGGWVQYGRIFIGKSRSLVHLAPTGNSLDAYNGEPVVTNGRGLYAPKSLVQWGDTVAFLASDGFVVFDGTNCIPIGGPPPRSLFRRLNVNALSAVTSIYKEDEGIVEWGLPLDGASSPSEVWIFDTKTGAWFHDTLAHSCLSLYMATDITYISELVGNISGLTGVIASLSASISQQAVVVYGKDDGTINRTDPSVYSEPGLAIVGEYISPALKPVGEEITVGGKPHIITEKDYLVLNEVVLTMLDLGATYSVLVDASIDGGKNWTNLGSTQVVTAGGSDLAPGVVEKRFARRFGLGSQGQLRIRPMQASTPWGFEEIRVNMDVLGQQRPASTLGETTPTEPEP